MTYPNMDLQSLPATIELRVGTDLAERTLQLAYYQLWAGIQGLKIVDDLGTVPEVVHNAGDDVTFATALDDLLTDLVAAMVHFDAIWAMVP